MIMLVSRETFVCLQSPTPSFSWQLVFGCQGRDLGGGLITLASGAGVAATVYLWEFPERNILYVMASSTPVLTTNDDHLSHGAPTLVLSMNLCPFQRPWGAVVLGSVIFRPSSHAAVIKPCVAP